MSRSDNKIRGKQSTIPPRSVASPYTLAKGRRKHRQAMLNARQCGGLMLRRRDTLLLIGAVMVAIGGALFFNPFHNEPLWTEWLLGPILSYLGGPLASLGAAIHFFGETVNT